MFYRSILPFLELVSSTVDVNECSSDPCVNGATCDDHVASYSCQCVPGYEGINCQGKHVCARTKPLVDSLLKSDVTVALHVGPDDSALEI